MYKIAVLGDRESVLGFGALGLDAFPVERDDEALETFKRLARSEEYAIVYVTEGLTDVLRQEIDKYKDAVAPAVILIPSRTGSRGMGLEALQKAVERAVGVDILSQSQGQ